MFLPVTAHVKHAGSWLLNYLNLQKKVPFAISNINSETAHEIMKVEASVGSWKERLGFGGCNWLLEHI